MPKDPPGNPGGLAGDDAWARVSGMQAKLHRWAAADPGRRFDDLLNLVHDPATLQVAFGRVAGNRGARSAGVDGLTVVDVAEQSGIPGFLEDLRAQLKSGSFMPLPVRERKIPKPGGSGKIRRLGIPTVADRVVQAALKLVLEPIFEADFVPVSYGFRPRRRAQDAIAEIHLFGSRAYQWALDADIEACFDSIDHTALMDRVRARVKDKRVLALVKAFLKAGVMTETGDREDSATGTPQGGILSPLLANIALSALDEHLHAPWRPGGDMSTGSRRKYRRQRGLPNWRLVRYADDFVVLVTGTREDVVAVREDIVEVLAPLGLRLAPEKTRVVHLDDGFDFLGFRIQRHRQWGSDRCYVYSYPSRKAVTAVQRKVKTITGRQNSKQAADVLFIRLGQITRGWALYHRHGAAKTAFNQLQDYLWHRVWTWLRRKHPTRNRKWIIRRYYPNGWWPETNGTRLYKPGSMPIQRHRYRGNKIPTPWTHTTAPATT
jgi:RNA-directed DNA polymerase